MLRRHARDRVGYWFLLALSTGIATLGLVLGSTGVVIGAMLVSPLMAPLVELGMGLAIGSPILVVRSFLRTVGSVVAVISASAGIAAALPYQEVTQEIASRTSPTLLDLFVAAFCALAAAFTTVRTNGDTVTTAAGTAIGIALVPPLCVGGYGLGTGLWQASAGALLLFTANFCAIVVFAVLSFLLLRFDRVDVHKAEQAVLEAGAPASRPARWLHVLLGSRHGPWLRLMMPIVMAIPVFFPLRRALTEVSWKTRVRKEVQAVLSSLPAASRAIRSTVGVEYQSVSVRLVILGSAADGRKLRGQLEARVGEVAGVRPVVDVVSVPDLDAVRELARPLGVPPLAPPVLAPILHLSDVQEDVAKVLEEVWPSASGPLLSWNLDLVSSDPPTLQVTHLGRPLGPAGVQLLATAMTTKLGGEVRIAEDPISDAQVEPVDGDLARFLPALAAALDTSRRLKAVHLCVRAPTPESKPARTQPPGRTAPVTPPRGDTATVTAADAAARELLASAHDRVQIEPGPWSLRLSASECPRTPPPADPASQEGSREPGSPPVDQRGGADPVPATVDP